VALTKGTPFNLLSLTKMMKLGRTLGGDNSTGITLTKDNIVLTFAIPIETPNGIVYAMHTRRSEIAIPALHQTMSFEQAHRLLGHQSDEVTRRTAKHPGWDIKKGSMDPCLPWTIGESKQKNTNKCSRHKASSLPGERIFTDIASIRLADGVSASKPHWCIKVDEFSQTKFSSFHAHKDEIVESSYEFFQRWKQGGNPVKFFRWLKSVPGE
jgi:hypothetical protein